LKQKKWALKSLQHFAVILKPIKLLKKFF